MTNKQVNMGKAKCIIIEKKNRVGFGLNTGGIS